MPRVTLNNPALSRSLVESSSLGRTVISPSQIVASLMVLTTVSPMSDIRMVSVGTASKDQKTKKGLPLLLVGWKSPYPMVRSEV